MEDEGDLLFTKVTQMFAKDVHHRCSPKFNDSEEEDYHNTRDVSAGHTMNLVATKDAEELFNKYSGPPW